VFIVNRKANYNDYEGDIFPLITPFKKLKEKQKKTEITEG